MWSPIKYLFGDSSDPEAVVVPVDRSFWGDEITSKNMIKHVAFVKYITGWLERHKIQDSVDVLLKPGDENTVRQLANAIKSAFRFNDQTHGLEVVLGVLLLYLKEMKSSLLQFESSELRIVEKLQFPLDKVHRIKMLKLLLASVKETHLEIVSLLCRFLHKISANHVVNHLTSSILGIYFTPLFFKDFVLPKKSVPEIVNYFLLVSSLINLSPFVLDNREVLLVEQEQADAVAQDKRDRDDRFVSRLEIAHQTVKSAGLESTDTASATVPLANATDQLANVSIDNEEICLRLESLDAQTKLAHEYFDRFLELSDEVEFANALSEHHGDIKRAAIELFSSLHSRLDSLARAIHAKYPAVSFESIEQKLVDNNSVATIISLILSAELETAHNSIQQLLGNNNTVLEIIEKLRQSTLNKENIIETSYAFLEKFKSAQVQKLLQEEARQIAAKIDIQVADNVSCELFSELMTKYVRVKYPNEPPNWQRIKKISEVHERLDEKKAAIIASTTTATTTISNKPDAKLLDFVPEVELFVPTKCDFGDTISVVVDFKAFVPSGSDYIEIVAEDVSSQHFNTYQWVTGKTVNFNAPSGCGTFHFKYFDYDANLKGKSSSLTVGPDFEVLANEVIVTPQKREVKVAVVQLSGKACPDLWVGMYYQGDVNLDYISYQYCDCQNKTKILTFNPPGDGRFQFRLFPQNNYQSTASCYVYVGAKDKADMSLNENRDLVVDFEINTLSNLPSHTIIWIGIYNDNGGEQPVNNWVRYFHVFDNRGKTIVPLSTPGKYVAKLFYTCPKISSEESNSNRSNEVDNFKYIGKIKVSTVEMQNTLLVTSTVIEVSLEEKKSLEI